MLTRIPVVYHEKIVPRRSRNPRTEMFGEWIDVEIAEADGMDAPVALRWRGNEIDGICERRWFQGKLWRPSVYSLAREPNRPVTAAEMIERTEQGHSYGNPLVLGVDWQVRRLVDGEIGPLDPAQCREIHTKAREIAINEALDNAERILVVDGQVWERTSEPVYVASRSGIFSREVYAYIDIKEVDGLRSNDNVFRVDRIDDLEHFVKSSWHIDLDRDCEVEVLIPECLTYDPELPALKEGLKNVVEWEQEGIGKKDRATILAWLDLRDAVAELEEVANDDNIAAAVTAAETWLAVANTQQFHKDRLVPVLERWHARPISFEEDGIGPKI